ncbi:hypothetical protein MUK42_03410 [Musa troglodytarum]|uniref:Uncharacterized protein n=1 Tax=Musa troglodytarum TaxID=320322 RepID=A0A9E7HGF4_9LILI|nr:hypothetical protein MUK42_03410 [Musa troglodytarum]
MDFMVKNLEIPCLVILQPGMARFGDQRTAYIADQSMYGRASTVDRYLLHGNRNLCRAIVGGRPGGNAGGVSSGRRFAETSDISSPTHGSAEAASRHHQPRCNDNYKRELLSSPA